MGKSPFFHVNDDVLLEICKAVKGNNLDNRGRLVSGQTTLKALSQVNRYMRDLMAPDLFKCICINISSWHDAVTVLKSAEKCRAVQNHTRRLGFKFCAGVGPIDQTQPQQLSLQLALILCKMAKLETILIDIPDRLAECCREVFEGLNVRLHSVQYLIMGPCTEWILRLCPNVQEISTCNLWLNSQPEGNSKRQHSFDLIKAAGEEGRLQHFEMNERWHPELLEAVVEAMPNISSLAITGTFFLGRFKASLSVLGGLGDLRTVATPRAAQLDVGFNPPRCGNAYHGDHGRQLRVQVEKERREANHRVARMIFSACRQLETLWIGDTDRATVIRSSDGTVLRTFVEPGERGSLSRWPQ